RSRAPSPTRSAWRASPRSSTTRRGTTSRRRFGRDALGETAEPRPSRPAAAPRTGEDPAPPTPGARPRAAGAVRTVALHPALVDDRRILARRPDPRARATPRRPGDADALDDPHRLAAGLLELRRSGRAVGTGT